MNAAGAPVLIAYDGSGAARRAIREAAELFGARKALVATVWEPGLAYIPVEMPGANPDLQPLPIDIEAAQEGERRLQAHARRVAEEGTDLARAAGLQAESLAVPDEVHIAETIVELAQKRGVAAIVIGSRGLSGLRARLEGSTSSGVLKRASCPVIVIHED